MKKIIFAAALLFILIGCGRDRFGAGNLLIINVSSFAFSAPACGSDPPAQTLEIIGEGEWRAASDVPWITPSPASGGVPATVTLTVSVSGLACGQTYGGTLTLFSPRGNSMPMPVTLTIPGAPAIALSPASLAFNSPACGSNPASQTFQITSSGGSLNWSASNIPSWLTLTPAAGAAPGAVTAGVDVTGLVCGKSYIQTVNIASAQAANSPMALTVTLTIPAAPATTPVIGVSKTLLSFTGAACGGTAANQTFDISNTGIGTLNWTGGAAGVSPTGSWPTINPSNGTLAAGASTTITVTVNATGLPCGATSSAAVTLTSLDAPNSPQTVSISVIVPSAAIITPSGTNLAFFAPACKVNPSPNTQNFTITNTGGTALTWSAASNQTWATVSPTGGTLAAGATSGNITVTVDATGLLCAQGASATITFTGTGGPVNPKTVHVGLSVPGAWQFQNPIPTGNHLQGAAFSDAGIAWAVGDTGTILRSKDNGNSWMPVASGTAANLSAIAFAGPLEGWTVGAGGTILHTTDGGATWGVESAPVSSTLRSLSVVDAAHVWAVGDQETILYRSGSWTNLSLSGTDQFTHIFMNDATHGWITSNSTTSFPATPSLLWTNNNWTTAIPQPLPAGTAALSSIFFLPPNPPATSVNGWAVGDPNSSTGNGTILLIQANDLTTPGTITPQNSGAPASLSDISFLDLNNGWAVGANGTILSTSNGGAWTSVVYSNPPAQLLHGLAFNGGFGVAVGFFGSVVTKGSGSSVWTTVSGGPTSPLNAVSFTPDGLYGWAVGAFNTILNIDLSASGAGNWVLTTVGGSFNGVSAVSSANVWAVGNNGAIEHYNGSGWTADPSVSGVPDTGNLNGVYFTSANDGWAVGRRSNGTTTNQIYHYNGSWSAVSSPCLSSTVTLNGVYFIDSQTGWVVGTSGAIANTANGGASWTCQAPDPSATWNSVYLTNALNGWVVGSGGKIYHYNGTAWAPQTSGTASTLYGVRFANASSGWIVGGGGLVLATTSGGSTWTSQQMVGTTQTLRSLYFTDLLNGWAVGTNGTILHTTTGGNN